MHNSIRLGSHFTTARLIYNAVVRPALTYEVAIWHTTPVTQGETFSGIMKKLAKVQS
jgi:hypothetical protein